jgi:hypothetical protein
MARTMKHPLPWSLAVGYVADAAGNVVLAVAPVELDRAPDEATARFIVECVNAHKEKKDGN